MANRNTEINANSLPALFTKRSRFHYYKNIKTSFNEGDLAIFYANELVQPGDTFNINMSFVARTNTPLRAVMDNAYYDTYLFAIPWLDVWDNTKAFFGENPEGAWINTTEYVTPRIKVPANANIGKHTILAYLGFRQGSLTNSYTVGGAMTIMSYNFVWNEYFRDQNYTAPKQIDKSGATITYDATNSLKGGQILKVCKLHDRFTTGLPEIPASVGIPLGTNAPVTITGNGGNIGVKLTKTGQTDQLGNLVTNGVGNTSSVDFYNGQSTAFDNYNVKFLQTGETSGYSTTVGLQGLADLTQAVSATLSAQRIALALNHIEERLGIFGRRYREIVRACWGVTPSDTAMHIPEYLGGKRTMMNMNQIVNSTEGTENAVLGSTGGYSLTSDVYELCNKSFVEHSILLGVMCLRCEQHNGTQGLDRQYLKSRKYDYYWDELKGLSFQPVYNGELFWQGTSDDMIAHHFLPSFEEYRGEKDLLTGEFSPDYANWLKEWTYARKLENLPVMSTEWIEEDSIPMDRTLENTSEISDNVFMDIQLEVTKYSITAQKGIPGIDKF